MAKNVIPKYHIQHHLDVAKSPSVIAVMRKIPDKYNDSRTMSPPAYANTTDISPITLPLL